MNVDELRNICDALGLPTDGVKQELIARLINFTPMENNNNEDDVDETTTMIETGTQTYAIPTNIITQNRINLKWIFVFSAVVVIVAVLFFLMKESNEKIEIIVNRPWFPWF